MNKSKCEHNWIIPEWLDNKIRRKEIVSGRFCPDCGLLEYQPVQAIESIELNFTLNKEGLEDD